MPDISSISSALTALKNMLGIGDAKTVASTTATSSTTGTKTPATNENELVSVKIDSNQSSEINEVDTKIKQLMTTDIPKTRSEIDQLVLKKAQDIEEQQNIQQKAIEDNKELLKELKEKYKQAKEEEQDARNEYDKAAKKRAKEQKSLRNVDREIKNVDKAMKSNKKKESILDVLQFKKNRLLSNQSAIQSNVDDYDLELSEAKSNLDKKKSTRAAVLDKIQENSGDDSPMSKLIKQSEQKIKEIDSTFESNLSTLQQTLTKQENELSSLMQKKAELVQKVSSTTTPATTTTTTTGTGDGTNTTGTTNTGGKLAEIFSSGNFSQGVLKDKGAFIEQCCQKYGVDPYLASAIMACETGWGTSNAIVSCNNPGGYMDVNTNCMELKHFNTLEEGIEAVIRNLSENYIKLGLTDISSIGAKYCPVGAANDPNGTNSGWIPSIVSIYKQLSGKEITESTKLA